jgi:hydrogenase/urease accessory protein HupE
MNDVGQPRLPLHVVVVLAVMACPALAEAHLSSTGMGPVYDGVVHFVTSPEDVAPVLALALLAGLRGADHGRRAVFVLPVTWLLGGLLGTTAPATSGSAMFSSIGVLLLGGLLATDAKLSLGGTTALALLLGLSHGYLNGSGMGHLGLAVPAFLGLASVVFVLVALAAAIVVPLRAHWARIAVRVAGSWIAASGLLMLGWAIRAR